MVIPDTGGGYAQSLMESMDSNEIPYTPYKGAAGSNYTSKCGIFTFDNIRGETYWRFREALDPNQPGGSRIALPPDRRIVADLTAPKFEVRRGQSGSMVIKITSKEDVIKNLGRSPDDGDAIVMAYFDGAKEETHAPLWLSQTNRPSVNMGHDAKRRKRR